MTTVPGAQSVHALIHELAEGLQSTGSYLAALRRGLATGDGKPVELEVVERAIAQWARSQHAMRELRAYLCQRDERTGDRG